MLSIVYVNACADKSSSKKLNFIGERNARALLLAKLALKYNGDLIYVNDWSPVAMSELSRVLGATGYSQFLPKEFEMEKEPGRYSAVSVLFVKETIPFKQEYRPVGTFETIYRYIMGKIEKKNITLVLKCNHIPPADENSLEVTERRKGRMLLDDIEFMNQMSAKEECAIAFGDYNGNRGAYNYVCQRELNMIPWHDVLKVPTYGDKQLDHVFVSPALEERYVVSAEAIDEGYMQLTDHKLIKITVEAKERLIP